MKLGYIVGRFQPLHLGHIELIKELKKNYDHFIVFIGSANQSKNIKNPLTFEERKKLLSNYICEELILPIDDVGNDIIWSQNLHQKIDHFINKNNISKKIKSIHFLSSNKDNDHKLRKQWMNDYQHYIDYYPITKALNATDIRNKIYADRIADIQHLIDKETYHFIINHSSSFHSFS